MKNVMQHVLVRDFNVEEMKYEDSLQQAITQMENELKQQHTEYAKLALDNLNSLKRLFYPI